jgi:hypothetical protein
MDLYGLGNAFQAMWAERPAGEKVAEQRQRRGTDHHGIGRGNPL